MVYVYKTLMNSLYGRFGINPQSTTTNYLEIRNETGVPIPDGPRTSDWFRSILPWFGSSEAALTLGRVSKTYRPIRLN